jgi:hypothetical protein
MTACPATGRRCGFESDCGGLGYCKRRVGFLTSPLTGGYSGPIVVDMITWRPNAEWTWRPDREPDLCEDCDQYHEPRLTVCPYEHRRRLQDFEEEEMDRAEYARHDRRLFG